MQIADTIGGYIFEWKPEKIKVNVSHLKTHSSDGRITGELLITTLDDKPIYPQTSINFNSAPTRSRLAKQLSERDNHCNWDEILDKISLHVIKRQREGEPVRELWTSEDVTKPEFILEPLLYKGLPTIMFGEKAVCKSTLGLLMYACLTLPWHENELGLKAPPNPVRTLYADWEVDYDIAHYNMKMLQTGMGLVDFPLYYRRCQQSLVDDIEQIQSHMSEIKAECLIVDSLAPAVGGDLKNAETALRFTQGLRKLRCSTLIIGQTSKDREAKTKSVFGSVFFEYYSRNICEVRKVQEEGENSLDIALYNTYNNLNKRFKPLGYHIHFNNSGTHIERRSITARELVARIGIQAEIIQLLKEQGELTTKDIIELLDVKRGNADMSLKRLRDKKIIQKSLEDKWQLLIV